MTFKWPGKMIIRKNWFPFSFLIIAMGKDDHEEEKEQRKTKRRKEKKTKLFSGGNLVGKQTIETLIIRDLENRAVLLSSAEAGLEISNDQLLSY